ncbi:hypothetical protein BIWAKO_06000 [Bosea sp. BIWAKO-01]|nr:hypothetical protein BIWAKO_06000 [Bosea sp. BIWAKO-01]
MTISSKPGFGSSGNPVLSARMNQRSGERPRVNDEAVY